MPIGEPDCIRGAQLQHAGAEENLIDARADCTGRGRRSKEVLDNFGFRVKPRVRGTNGFGLRKTTTNKKSHFHLLGTYLLNRCSCCMVCSHLVLKGIDFTTEHIFLFFLGWRVTTATCFFGGWPDPPPPLRLALSRTQKPGARGSRDACRTEDGGILR